MFKSHFRNFNEKHFARNQQLILSKNILACVLISWIFFLRLGCKIMTFLMLMIIKNTQVGLIVINKNELEHTIRTRKKTCDCAQECTNVDFSQPSAIDIETQMNISYQQRALLPDLVNKRRNTNTCNKLSTSFYCKYVLHQIIFSTHCIVLKMTYDMRDYLLSYM